MTFLQGVDLTYTMYNVSDRTMIAKVIHRSSNTRLTAAYQRMRPCRESSLTRNVAEIQLKWLAEYPSYS